MNTFEQNIIKVYRAEGREWLTNLPSLIEEMSEKWNLSNLKKIDNLSFHYVLSGYRNKQPIILKVGLDIQNLSQEVLALEAFSGYGAVTVLEHDKGVILLERAVPGDSLSKFNSKHSFDRIEIACNVMNKLHQAPIPPNNQFSTINDWLSILDNEWKIPTHLLRKARFLKKKLLLNSTEYVLLHGDLHLDNIIKDGDEWLVIDPKGLIGFPINETWAFIMDIEKDTKYIAERFNFDLTYVREWYFVHLIIAALWNLKDALSPDLFLNLAEQTFPMIDFD